MISNKPELMEAHRFVIESIRNVVKNQCVHRGEFVDYVIDLWTVAGDSVCPVFMFTREYMMSLINVTKMDNKMGLSNSHTVCNEEVDDCCRLCTLSDTLDELMFTALATCVERETVDAVRAAEVAVYMLGELS